MDKLSSSFCMPGLKEREPTLVKGWNEDELLQA